MTNNFKQAQKHLENNKCKKCDGLGELDDSDCGDMYYNTWKCDACGGTGMIAPEDEISKKLFLLYTELTKMIEESKEEKK